VFCIVLLHVGGMLTLDVSQPTMAAPLTPTSPGIIHNIVSLTGGTVVSL